MGGARPWSRSSLRRTKCEPRCSTQLLCKSRAVPVEITGRHHSGLLRRSGAVPQKPWHVAGAVVFPRDRHSNPKCCGGLSGILIQRATQPSAGVMTILPGGDGLQPAGFIDVVDGAQGGPLLRAGLVHHHPVRRRGRFIRRLFPPGEHAGPYFALGRGSGANQHPAAFPDRPKCQRHS